MRLPKNGLFLLLTIAITAAGAAAQNDTIRVSTQLVQVNVVVRDKNGPVQGLKASDFTVLDNKKTQKIELFSMLDGHGEQKSIVEPGRAVSNFLEFSGGSPLTLSTFTRAK